MSPKSCTVLELTRTRLEGANFARSSSREVLRGVECSYGGPAQRRYAQYFLSILYTPDPPPSQDIPLCIDNVIITGLDEIKTYILPLESSHSFTESLVGFRNLRVTKLLSARLKDCLLHPVLVIYQKGQLKWKQVVPIKVLSLFHASF